MLSNLIKKIKNKVKINRVLKNIGTIQDLTLLKKAEQELHIYKTDLEELVALRTDELEIAKKNIIQEKLISDTLIDSLPSLFFLLNGKSEILKINKFFIDVTGYDENFLIGSNIRDIIIGDFHRYKEVRLSILKNKHAQFETQIRTKKGDLIPFLFTVSKIPYNGKDRYIGTGSDLTVLRSAMKEISKLSQVVEQSLSTIIITDLNGQIEYANPAFKEATGYSESEVLRITPREFLNNSDNATLWETICNGDVWKGELINTNKNGLEFWESATISPIKDRNGEIESFLVIKENINERKELEESVKMSEERYRILFEQAGDAIVLIDVDTDSIVDFNKEAYKNLDYDNTQFTMISMEKLELKRKDTKSFLQHREILLDKGFDSYETELLSYHGNIVNMWINSRIIRIKNKKYIQSMWRDVTDIKILENKLILEKNRAESSTMVKSMFLANMSHEIRTPMNSIIGFIELSLESDNLDPTIYDYLNTSLGSARSLLTLINDILNISKLESGKLKIEKNSFNLHKLLKEVMEILMNLVNQNSVKLIMNIDPDIPKCIVGDVVRLRQVLLNLVGNSIKFTSEGSITININYYNENQIQFKIVDTGIGMSPDQLNQLFIPFAQGDDSTARKYGGTGLGTTISRDLVRLMGGEILVTSELGEGSIFTFAIPAEYPECAANCDVKCDEFDEQEPEKLTKNKRYYNVLLAEDIEDNAALVSARLLKEGYALTMVNSGLEAINEFKSGEYDLILMDVHMPLVNGIEATKEIRKLESNNSIPIIALTASVMLEDQQKCFNAGMNAVVSKPIQFRELFATIEEFVDDHRGNIVPYTISGIDQKNDVIIDVPGINYQKAIGIWQDHNLYHKSLYSFIDRTENVGDECNKLLNSRNYNEIYEKVHAIKGVSGNLSLINIERISSDIIQRLNNKNYTGISKFIKCLDLEMSVIKESYNIIIEMVNKENRKFSREQLVDLINSSIDSSMRGDILGDKMESIFSSLNSRISGDILNKLINSYNIYDLDQTCKLLRQVLNLI